MSTKAAKEDKKYLTEMKELPNYDKAENDVENPNKKTAPQFNAVEKDNFQESLTKNIAEEKALMQTTNPGSRLDNNLDKFFKPEVPKSLKRIAGIPFSTRDFILNSINVLTLILLFVMLSRIEGKAKDLKEVQNENIKLSENYNYNTEQVDINLKKAEEINSLFTTDTGVIDFVNDVERLNASGATRSVNFSSPDPVKDRSGSFGRPIIINLRGNWSQIDQAIDEIHNLPYYFRPIKVEIETADLEEGSGNLDVRYGGLLYLEETTKDDQTNK